MSASPDPRSVGALDRRRVRRAFNRASQSYDAAARVQREVRERLLDHLEPVLIDPDTVLDVGAGTGALSRTLCERYPRARTIALDFATGMLVEARRQAGGGRWSNALRRLWRTGPKLDFLCADAHALPFAAGSIDLLCSNLALQWMHALPQALREFARVLRHDGLLMVSTFGPDTLIELRDAWASVDGGVHVHDFMDMHDLGDALVGAGFGDVVVDAERLHAEYDDVLDLARELKAIGASNASVRRSRALTGRSRLEALQRAYPRDPDTGRLEATYEVVYAHAWVKQRTGREVSVPSLIESLGHHD